MSDVYKLPGSSYEEIVKIIQAYAFTSRNGTPVSLGELVQSSRIDKTIISRNNAFLVQANLITEGNKKSPTELCMKLGRAYQMKIEEQIIELWNEIVQNDDFMNRMISSVQVKGEILKNDFINHIVFSSGNNSTSSIRAGASAIVEILKLTKLIDEHEGKICVGNGSFKKLETTIEKIDKNKDDNSVPRSEQVMRESQIAESGYYIQAYTCESGKAAKLIIPEDATRDDLCAFSDMLNIVLRRKFKVSTIE